MSAEATWWRTTSTGISGVQLIRATPSATVVTVVSSTAPTLGPPQAADHSGRSQSVASGGTAISAYAGSDGSRGDGSGRAVNAPKLPTPEPP